MVTTKICIIEYDDVMTSYNIRVSCSRFDILWPAKEVGNYKSENKFKRKMAIWNIGCNWNEIIDWEKSKASHPCHMNANEEDKRRKIEERRPG